MVDAVLRLRLPRENGGVRGSGDVLIAAEPTSLDRVLALLLSWPFQSFSVGPASFAIFWLV